METIIQVRNVSKRFHRQASVLKNLNLDIPRSKLVVVKGRSGSGKTTLLNIIGGLDTPTEGSVFVDGKQISAMGDTERSRMRRKAFGFIFQSFALVATMSAYENIEFGLRIAGVPRRQQHLLVRDALEAVGLTKRAQHRPHELSGGEQQRVAIARAIAHRPMVVLADEPTAELDSRTGLHIIGIFRRLVREQGISIVMTTHDPAIMELADLVYELEDGVIVSSVENALS